MSTGSVISDLVINLLAAIILLVFPYAARSLLMSQINTKQLVRGTIALFALLFVGIVLVVIFISTTFEGPVVVIFRDDLNKLATPEPTFVFKPPPAPVATTITPSSTPTPTPTASLTSTTTPSTTATSSATSTGTPTASATNTNTASATNTVTRTLTPRATNTPTPIVYLSYLDRNCTNPSHNARITDVAVDAVRSASDGNILVVQLHGVAYRSDFTEYKIYWADPSLQSQPIESGKEFKFVNEQKNLAVLQSRPLFDIVRPNTYQVTLRVLGSGNGQYQECSVTLSFR